MNDPLDPKSLIAPWVQELTPYHVEDAIGLVKLDAMENPYGFPERLVPAWLAQLQKAEIHRYPDPNATALKASLVKQLDLPDQHVVSVGNGSDELIHMLCLAFNNPGAKLMAPAPSFAVYSLAAAAVGMQFVDFPLRREDFAIDVAEMLKAIEQHNPALIFIASPNNPTANRFADEDIRLICEHSRGLVVLDEAYWRFAGEHRIHALADISNIVFMHTLSKIGLAGIRIGALIGTSDWLEPVERVRMPYNVGSLSLETATFALNHEDVFLEQISQICKSREQLMVGLGGIVGVAPFPSETNFILFRVDAEASEVHAALKDKGILIKNVSGMHEYLRNCLRVSVGTDAENQQFLDALAAIV